MDPIILITILAVMALAGTLTIAVYRSVSRPASADDFDTVLARVTGGDLAEVDTTLSKAKKESGKGFSWDRFWLEQVSKTGRPVEDPKTPGRLILGLFVLAAFFGIVVYPGGVGGAYVGVLALAVVWFWLGLEQSKRRRLMDKQMPLLLSGMRTQMHAGVTVQGALLAVADDLPSPLGDEMRLVRDDVNVGVPMEKALETLATRMKSRVMQFLVSSIGVAIKSGSDLVPQLMTIEEIVQQRARIDGKIRSAVALAKPTAYLAMAAPPGMAVWMFISDPTYLPYFFGAGILMLAIGVALYVAGVVLIQIMIKNVEKI